MFFSHPATRQRSAVVPGLYHVHHGDVFLPGAGNIVFEPLFSLPLIQLIGAATYAGPAPDPLQRTPQIFVSQSATVAGIGGMVAGQFMTQPLNVPFDTTNGTQ